MDIPESVNKAYSRIRDSQFDHTKAFGWSIFFSIRWLLVGAFGGVMGAALLADLSRSDTLEVFAILVVLVTMVEFGFRLALGEERL